MVECSEMILVPKTSSRPKQRCKKTDTTSIGKWFSKKNGKNGWKPSIISIYKCTRVLFLSRTGGQYLAWLVACVCYLTPGCTRFWLQTDRVYPFWLLPKIKTWDQRTYVTRWCTYSIIPTRKRQDETNDVQVQLVDVRRATRLPPYTTVNITLYVVYLTRSLRWSASLGGSDCKTYTK